MISYIREKHIRYEPDENGKEVSVRRVEIRGMSTDEKPVKHIANGSVFLEIDTKIPFLFDEDDKIWR